MRVLGYACTALGVVPLVWLSALYRGGRRFPSMWWWVAGAYGVSFPADLWALAGWSDPWAVSTTYPVSAAGVVGMVLLTGQDSFRFLGVLVVMVALAALFPPAEGTVPVRVVAWGAVAVLAFRRPDLGRLRYALLTTFGLGLLSWWCYVRWGSLGTWSVNQGVRAIGTALFCWAALQPRPFLSYR